MHSAIRTARPTYIGHASTEYSDLDSEPLSESRNSIKKKTVTFQDDPRTSSTTSASSSVKTAPKTEDILRSGREWTKGAATSSTTTASETQKQPVKNLSFHTQVMCNTNIQTDPQELTEIFHSVRGLRRRGLTIDPGAANGLIGSETLRDLLEHCRNADRVHAGLRWNYEKNSSVTGISGSSDTTLGEVMVPLPMLRGLEDACYTADVIGGSGSLCPALIGNPSLVKMKATIATAWFDNRDGLLIIPKIKAPGEHHTLRLLLTDSGHYLLPLDEEPDSNQENNQAGRFLTDVARQCAHRWSDQKHNYYVHSCLNNPELKRSEEKKINYDKNEPVHTANMEQAPDHHQEDPPDSIEIVDDHEGDEPEDYWEVSFQEHGIQIDRVHVRPRARLFSPTDVELPPGVRADVLRDERQSTLVVPGEAEHRQIQDNWRVDNPIVGFTWTGRTRFWSAPSSNDLNYSNEYPMTYEGDYYPDGLEDNKISRLNAHYKAVPEEFYNKSSRPVLRPQNFQRWKKQRQRKANLWELCSGSGRLSWIALVSGLVVANPINYRYGWDLANKEHQNMILEMQDILNPDVIAITPSCRPWTVSANRRSKEETRRLREAERPVLEFLVKICWRQHEKRHGFFWEQPWGSAMWRNSPLACIQDIPDCRPRVRADQCMFGCTNESLQPIQKATGLQANITLRKAINRCAGHGGRKHAQLQGSSNGKLRTTQAAVYPGRFCKAIVADIMKYIQGNKSGAPQTTYLTNHQHTEIYYKCERCRLGRAAPPDMEHTLVPRECRVAASLPTPASSTAQVPIRRACSDYSSYRLGSGVQGPSSSFTRGRRSQRQCSRGVPVHCGRDDHLKYLFSIISAKTDKYTHWNEDPIYLSILKQLFRKSLTVKGVCCTLHAEMIPTPMPYLRTSAAPLRIVIKGDVKRWSISALEDIRTMTNEQLHQRKLYEDWMIVIYGHEGDGKDYWEVDHNRGKVVRFHMEPRKALFTPMNASCPVSVDKLAETRTTHATPHELPGPRLTVKDNWTQRDAHRLALDGQSWTGTTEFDILEAADPQEAADPVQRLAEAGPVREEEEEEGNNRRTTTRSLGGLYRHLCGHSMISGEFSSGFHV